MHQAFANSLLLHPEAWDIRCIVVETSRSSDVFWCGVTMVSPLPLVECIFSCRDGRNTGPVLAYQFETQLLFFLQKSQPLRLPFVCLLHFLVRRTSMAKTSDLVLEVIAFISDLQQTCFNIDFTSAKTPTSRQQIKSLPSKGISFVRTARILRPWTAYYCLWVLSR